MTESKQERKMRLDSALQAIENHSVSNSFADLIENNIDVFKGFKIIYSTENIESQLLDYPLKTIEEQCPYLKKFFMDKDFFFILMKFINRQKKVKLK